MFKRLNFQWVVFLLLIICQPSFAIEKKIEKKFQPWLLEVRLNEVDIPYIVTCYTDAHDKIWVNQQDLINWRLKLPKNPSHFIHHEAYYPLEDYSNLSYHLDKQAMRLYITADPQLFPTKFIDANLALPHLLRPERPGGRKNI